MIPPLKTKPIRTVLRWQLIATAVIAAIAGAAVGWDGALSAMLGGLINLVGGRRVRAAPGTGSGVRGRPTAGMSLVAMLRAEAGKILLILGRLWLVLSIYRDVVPVAFFAAFVVTVVIFSMAIFVRD